MDKNAEGYSDPTAGTALRNIDREQEADRLALISALMPLLKKQADIVGFEIIGRITLKDKETGREYR
ncbi:MAG: hypothetical protein HFJ86_12165 [Oscillospiraceae bacterium]|jgi:hypothetical protein|nr:hypothetical protein [Oscillospiraceae bacterium]